MDHGYNWSSALVAYLRGTTLEDISLAMAIPIHALKNKAHRDSWRRLAADNPTTVSMLPTRADKVEAERAKMEENRARNLEVARLLQQDLLAMAKALVAGTLLIEKTTSTGGTVKVPPSIKDRADLSAHARNVAELSYRALGDAPAAGPEGAGAGLPAVTIVLPVQIAAPRAGRPEVVEQHVLECKEAEVVDVRLAVPAVVDATPPPTGEERVGERRAVCRANRPSPPALSPLMPRGEREKPGGSAKKHPCRVCPSLSTRGFH